MKQTCFLLCVCAAVLPLGAQIRTNVNVNSIFNTPAWESSFFGDYGVQSGTEPELPAGSESPERDALIAIRDILQNTTLSELQQVQSALAVAERYITDYRRSNPSPDANPHPRLTELAATLSARMAELVSNNPTESRSYLDRSVNYYEMAIKAFPRFERALKNVANIYFRTERKDKARDYFQQAVAAGNNDPITFGLLGYIYFDEGRLVAAETSLRNALVLNPTLKEFRVLLGQTLFNQGRYQEAIALFTEVLKEDPSNVDFWKLQANAYIALDQINEATHNLEMIRLMGGSDVDSLLLLGDVYVNRNMVDDATAAYTQALEVAQQQEKAASAVSGSFGSIMNAVQTLVSLSAYDQSLQLLQKLQEALGTEISNDQQRTLLTLRANINMAMGEQERAVEVLEEIVRQDPFAPSALLGLGRYYATFTPSSDLSSDEATVRIAEAQQQAFLYFERVQELDPQQSLETKRAVVDALIQEAQLRVRRGERQRAIELLERAQTLDYRSNVQDYLNQLVAASRGRA